MTELKSLLMENSKGCFFSNCFMLELIFSSDGNKTKRGSGHHQRIYLFSYHGKIPLRYACNNLSLERSPPIASRPSSSAISTGGNRMSWSRAINDIGNQEFKKCKSGVG